MARSIICNMCGKEFSFWDEQHNFGIRSRMGYGSNYDGEEICMDLCIDCVEKLAEKCKIFPLTNHTGIENYAEDE